MGAVPARGEQGSGGRAGQLCQPCHQVLPFEILGRGARRRQLWARRRRADRRSASAVETLRRPDGRPRSAQIGGRAARDLGRGQRIPAIGGAMDHVQDRSRCRRRANPAGAEPDQLLRDPVGAVHPRCGSVNAGGYAYAGRRGLAVGCGPSPVRAETGSCVFGARSAVCQDHRRRPRGLGNGSGSEFFPAILFRLGQFKFQRGVANHRRTAHRRRPDSR